MNKTTLLIAVMLFATPLVFADTCDASDGNFYVSGNLYVGENAGTSYDVHVRDTNAQMKIESTGGGFTNLQIGNADETYELLLGVQGTDSFRLRHVNTYTDFLIYDPTYRALWFGGVPHFLSYVYDFVFTGDVKIDGELSISGVEGANNIVCVKPNGNLGTCTSFSQKAGCACS